MYQVNYNGLKKRESYDEIVATIENDQTKVKYPNRCRLADHEQPLHETGGWGNIDGSAESTG
jgi:hypothetical protein